MTYLRINECIKGHVYKLRSRNLTHGVYDGNTGFIGIRTKFGQRYLFTEYHYDAPAFATAQPTEAIGTVPATMQLVTSLGIINERDGLAVRFEKAIEQGGKGWVYAASGNPVHDAQPLSVPNLALFKLLDTFK